MKWHRVRFGRGYRRDPVRALAALLGTLLALAVFAAAAELLKPRGEIGGRPLLADGDSFRLGGTRVRLIGMDAPELTETCQKQDGGEWACGIAARERLRELTGAGLQCQWAGHDVYDRVLATCKAGGRDVAAVLVREGLARADGRYADEEAEARRTRRGLWEHAPSP